ncbi:coiled-coil domain-containing protein 157 isoform X5 [Trachemys scripta elegans]|nr:coiled-coil domain-containing protein 157 isoform X5 [Trachemys scripta elegans]XP_034646807.1 coiled-coil domain-containing protein 157 isoform X5 [Trachemys scripta elegans]XP_034646808.1 coiled-coil domain-containing protein 157 isoform X5 [Trachemys scripta elegans]XP_034646810.1 coiled-coil domain-containing protein 157 isoform X5 [Trachemys scripta elegans]XP_034646811.1 coiled-coil domain-containing protein 157 isoform X5 [Trachemys scripta elegans]
MAYLLGNPNCMESLRKDITDLQGAIIDVFSRAGAVRYPSWKFPNKVSCDLDLVALLEHYDYVENDPEFTQHSHVMLLELVIDRLLLLLQSFTGYMENLISKQAVPPSQAVGPCMSIGLAVRKYWNSTLKLGALHQQLVTEKKSNRRDISALKSTLQDVKAENEHLKSCSPMISESGASLASAQSTLSCLPQTIHGPDCDFSDTSQPRSAYGVTKNVCSVHSQTIESSLVPCDACASGQASLREVGKAIISICHSQNIPSSLGKFQEMVEETLGNKPLTAMDMSFWASEQSKDLSRINKHLGGLMQLINPLKAELEESEKQKDELRKQVEDFDKLLQKENETQERQRKAAEQYLEEKIKENLQITAKLEKDKEDLRTGAVVLEERISTLKEELLSQQATMRELELTKSTLLEEMRTKMAHKSQMTKLEDQVQLLTSQLENASHTLSGATTQLDKEKAKVESMLRHEESLQAKQRALLQQLDCLDQECEELRASLGEAEDDKAKLEQQLKETQAEKRQVQGQLEAQQQLMENLQQEKLSFEQSTSELLRNISELDELLQELKERERLLVSFPDLHIPAEAQFESTGDIADDMEKQLQANNIRISVLEEENSRLRTALAKMKETAQEGVLRQPFPRTQTSKQHSAPSACEWPSQQPEHSTPETAKQPSKAIVRRGHVEGNVLRLPSSRELGHQHLRQTERERQRSQSPGPLSSQPQEPPEIEPQESNPCWRCSARDTNKAVYCSSPRLPPSAGLLSVTVKETQKGCATWEPRASLPLTAS